jgi:hypothetical protein
MSSSSKVSKSAAKDSSTPLINGKYLKFNKDLLISSSIKKYIELFKNFPIATASFINITGGNNIRLQKKNKKIKEYGQTIIIKLEGNKQVIKELKTALIIVKLSGQSQNQTAKLEKISDLVVFDGAKKKPNNFITNIRIKLNINADYYTSKE